MHRGTIAKKVCMVGAFAVGKTSLVRRFVENLYDDRYLTTVGVKVDRRVVELEDQSVNIMLWDLAGEDAFADLRLDYLRGASGFILVADGTRPETLDVAVSLRNRIHGTYGNVPFVLALNKVDLETEWGLDEDRLAAIEQSAMWTTFRTSALTGDSVEAMFSSLAEEMVSR